MTVSISYEGPPTPEIEDHLCDLSTRYEGKLESAGLWMIPPMQRDIQFVLPDDANAEKFRLAMVSSFAVSFHTPEIPQVGSHYRH